MRASTCWCLFVMVIYGVTVRQANANEGCRFAHQPPKIGEQITQWVKIASDLQATILQDKQIVSSENRRVQSEQFREITILEIAKGNSTKIKLTYAKAQSVDTSDPRKPRIEPQPVANKSYLVSRPGEQLVVTDLAGRAPPPEELTIVKANMQSIGKSNPLAAFLRNRTVRIGESLVLPRELAADLLNGANKTGQLQQVVLKLRNLHNVEGDLCAEFEMTIQGGPGAVGVQKGMIVIEANTCRSRSFVLDNTLASAEQRGPVGNTFTVSHRGKVRVAVRASYRSGTLPRPLNR